MPIIGSKIPQLQNIRTIILENQETWQKEIKSILSKLTLEQRWELIKITLADLGKNKARDLVRLLLNNDFPFLRGKLEDTNNRYLAIECMGYLPARETVEQLVELLQHRDEYVQLCAAGALKNHTPRLVVPYLVKAMMYDQLLPARVGEVLLDMGYLAQDTLLEVYSLAIPKVRVHMMELFTQGGNPKCKPFVVQALESNNSALKDKALDAVLLFKFEDLWQQVVDCLLEPAWTMRAKALDVLAKLRIKEAVPYVELLLDDQDQWVRQCAVNCLNTLEPNQNEEGIP